MFFGRYYSGHNHFAAGTIRATIILRNFGGLQVFRPNRTLAEYFFGNVS